MGGLPFQGYFNAKAAASTHLKVNMSAVCTLLQLLLRVATWHNKGTATGIWWGAGGISAGRDCTEW